MDDETNSPELILAQARERYAAGKKLRGLARPADAPDGAWYSLQPRKLASGVTAVYLMLRWRDGNASKARSLGRLDNGAPA